MCKSRRPGLFPSPPCLERVTRIGLGTLLEAGQGAHIVATLRGLWVSNQNLGLYEVYRGLSKTLPDLTRDTSGLLIGTRQSIDVALKTLERRASRLHYGVTTSALASRLRASWMAATVTKVARVSAWFSKSLARRLEVTVDDDGGIAGTGRRSCIRRSTVQ